MVAVSLDELEAGVTTLAFTRVASFLFVLYIAIQWRFLLAAPHSPLISFESHWTKRFMVWGFGEGTGVMYVCG